jgi:ketosteroid isomerase-like protein
MTPGGHFAASSWFAVYSRGMQDVASHIVGLERAALDRWGQGDPGAFEELCAPDVAYFDPFVPKRIDGVEALKAYYAAIKGQIRIAADEMIDPKVHLLGGAAVLTYNYESHGVEGGMRWNATEVYAKHGDEWKIVHTHWSLTKSGGNG